jgi:hypothetical protein
MRARDRLSVTPADPAPPSAARTIDDATLAAIATALALERETPLPVGPPAPSGWRTAARLEGVQRLV